MKPFSLALLLFLSGAYAAAENWPCFRGPSRQGISSETGLPTRWSNTENVVWKVEIPGLGWSSPIVFGDRVLVTTAIDDGQSLAVICLDRVSGKLLWSKPVFRQTLTRKEPRNSFATATPVADAERVYALSFNGKIAALDMAGNVVWKYEAVEFFSRHGLGSSPILYEDLLIVAFDGSSPGEDELVGWKKPWDQALILALDKRTGKVRWQGRRGMSRIAHVVPNIACEGDRDILVSAAGDVVQGHDLTDGRRIWSVFSQGEGVVPSIVVADGLVYACSGFEKPAVRAIRTGGTGDVTATHIAWEQTKAVPMICSFLYFKPYLFTISDNGVAMCLDAQTGKAIWQERIGGSHSASPILADGNIYLLAEDGQTTIIEAKPKFRIVATNSIPEKCQASLAASQGQVFLRTEKNLYCLGQQ